MTTASPEPEEVAFAILEVFGACPWLRPERRDEVERFAELTIVCANLQRQLVLEHNDELFGQFVTLSEERVALAQSLGIRSGLVKDDGRRH